MPRFYLPQPLAAGSEFNLPEAQARHVQVVRMQPGEAITLFNGEGGEYTAVITEMGKRNVAVRIASHDDAHRESPLHLTLVQVMTAADRMDYTIQKATELGVNIIQPITSQYCQQRVSGERAEKRLAHWEGVAAAAAEQCGRTRVPQILPILSLEHWLARPCAAELKLLLCPTGAVNWNSLPASADSAIMLVGPEGGFSATEDEMAIAQGYTPVVLGPRLFRAETVTPVVAGLLQARYGDF
ncbi:16S rRNA (uracil(1498)-N(3))-methyltransferase [Chitinilyticum piscinae]|uniref:Ribosomal RNA small subunit methyltransferase E n=1 Tax=Chitinilyticum piscinae TaxID=2866724 RepID=A0A8J7FPB6_9NEIS|nr:16S rRNA (uracil(1498)-N(3))-methyltransferase [Chitinilyticum piscinae]MBE9608061.1 16S rRNA (uracil(1498)-N(3))-methyltransferase [Chitinilyticum piscinae]